MLKFLGFLTGLFGTPYVLQSYWNWFIVKIFNVTTLTLVQSYVLLLCMGLIFGIFSIGKMSEKFIEYKALYGDDLPSLSEETDRLQRVSAGFLMFILLSSQTFGYLIHKFLY